jgi:anti-sigma factor RsiW
MDHVENKIKACIDGELAPAEAEAVRAHCRACESCARAWAQIEAVERVLAEADPIEASASIWPQVAARVRSEGLLGESPEVAGSRRIARRIAWRPRLQPAFALGAAIAVVAGLAVGLVLGPGRTEPDANAAADTINLASGSLLADEGATTLDEVYLAATYDGE